MRFSIITPSFRNSQWLRLCIASVADQQGVEVEHIVQDACSDDGTQEWLRADPRVKAFIEKDQGMYDAVNRGFRRSTGDLLAYLNCDEQYLPGALRAVHEFFADHPRAEVVLGDTIVTDIKGNYSCHRCSLAPRGYQMWIRFPVLTCALFVRRRVVEEMGILFDTQWRDLGDWYWVMEMVKRRLSILVMGRLTSVFADTGENMNLKPNAVRESRLKWQKTPRWAKLLKPLIILHSRLRLEVRNSEYRKPFEYSLYTLDSPTERVTRRAASPTSVWKRVSVSPLA